MMNSLWFFVLAIVVYLMVTALVPDDSTVFFISVLLVFGAMAYQVRAGKNAYTTIIDNG